MDCMLINHQQKVTSWTCCLDFSSALHGWSVRKMPRNSHDNGAIFALTAQDYCEVACWHPSSVETFEHIFHTLRYSDELNRSTSANRIVKRAKWDWNFVRVWHECSNQYIAFVASREDFSHRKLHYRFNFFFFCYSAMKLRCCHSRHTHAPRLDLESKQFPKPIMRFCYIISMRIMEWVRNEQAKNVVNPCERASF